MASKPVAVELVWSQGFQFEGSSGSNRLTIDGDSQAGPSPVQLMVFGLASCMAIDVLDIVRKGRHAVTAFRATLVGERAPEPPKRLLRATLRFEIHGSVPPATVERAIALSREKYCSVWHSMREDIQLATSFELHPPPASS
jgi:putative redox protein